MKQKPATLPTTPNNIAQGWGPQEDLNTKGDGYWVKLAKAYPVRVAKQ